MKIRNLILPIIFVFFVNVLIFFKFFASGLYPIPGDLLVSFYFPWYSGSWEGYNPWTTHKEMLGSDSVRQIYLWKEFAFEQIKQGKSPLWNPYTFSGQPLAANFQSSIFYPFNAAYFLTDPKTAWTILIMLQPFLAGIFMYMVVRSFKISKIGSSFAAIAFMFSSYQITWMELGTVSHSYAYLPLTIWAINKYFEKFKARFLLVLTLGLSMSILAGHPQTAIYVYIATFLFWLYKVNSSKHNLLKYFLIISILFLITFFLASIQLVPTYDFYKKSPISLPFSAEVFDRSIFPYKNLLTFFASDFFGHPANNNFWSQSYGDFTPYFGVIPMVFAFWAIYKLWAQSLIKFAGITSLVFIIAAGRGPITWFIRTFHLPLLDSTTPSRFIAISIFFLVILAAFGLEDFIKNLKDSRYLSRFINFLKPIFVVYVLLWLFAIFGVFFLSPKDTWQVNLSVTRRNLVLPTLMFLCVALLPIALKYFKNLKKYTFHLSIIGLFSVTLVGGFYYSNKFLAFAPKQFIFPDHPLFYWLKNNAGLDRFYGQETTHIDFNFPTHYQIYGSEGYDTLRFRRYAELLASGRSGKVPNTYLRSDASFVEIENGYRKRLFEILGVKYLLDKEDEPKTGADWHYERFVNDNIKGYWQYGKFQVYKRKDVLPRVFLTTNYYVAKNDTEIIDKIYDPSFDLRTVILEQQPTLKIEPSPEIIEPQLIEYEPSVVVVKTDANQNSLLYLSDVYDPDWQAYVDGNSTRILRAHYALRSVEVPAGTHEVTFKYQPKSYNQGLYLTLITIVGLTIASLVFIFKRKF